MRKYLYLFFALVCFSAIITILILSGYLGVFDTVKVTTRGYQLILSPDETVPPTPDFTTYVTLGDRVSFAYTLENRQYSPYETHIEATLLEEGQSSTLVLFSEDVRAEPFQKLALDWAIDPAVLSSRGFGEGQYTVKISRGGVVQKAITFYYSSPPKTPYYIPVPVPP